MNKYIKNIGLMLLMMGALAFSSCGGNKENKATTGEETEIADETEQSFDSANHVSETSGAKELSTGDLQLAYVIDDSIRQNYELMKDLRATLEKKQKEAQEKLQREQRRAEKRAREIQEALPTMWKDEQQKAQEEMMQLEMDFQRTQQELQSDLMRFESEFVEQYFKSVQAFLKKYTKEKGYDFIFTYQPGGSLLFADDAYNVTSEVLKGLNDAYRQNKKTGKGSN